MISRCFSRCGALVWGIAFVVVVFMLNPSHVRGESINQLPCGPKGPGRFGAYYAKLKYDAAWDKAWRVGQHADVVVRFDMGGHKLVFWRGTSYIPCWVTDTDIWYTNEFVERRGHHSSNTKGCCEPMSDKQCRYSHVRIIENNEARVVVHWRYAPVDVGYNSPFIDPQTGWSDWVDEYYTIYPDAVGVRKVTAHTTRPDLWMEWQEAIVLHQPGRRPEDNIELGAVSVANMQGQSKTYYWTDKGAPEFAEPKNANIQRINLKAKVVPFTVVSPPAGEGSMITPYGGHAKVSKFQWWNHWPVSQDASDGTTAKSTEKASCSSLSHIALHEPKLWKDYAQGEKWRTKIMLHGMTDKKVTDLIPLAKSWLSAPDLSVKGAAFSSEGYDPAERAFQLTNKEDGSPAELHVQIAADEERPIINPVLVIKNWGESDAALVLDGAKVKRGKEFRFGYRHTLEGTDLIVWIKAESTKPMGISILPVK